MSSNLAFFLCISLLLLIVPSSHAEFAPSETQIPMTEEIVSTPSEALPQELPIVTPTVVTPTEEPPVPHINPSQTPPTETPLIEVPLAEEPATDGNEIPPSSNERGMPPAAEKETPPAIEKETPQTADKETNPATEQETPPQAVEKETPPPVIEKGTPRGTPLVNERPPPTERRPVNDRPPPRVATRQEKQERLNERLNERERTLEQEKEKEREKQEIHERVARERMEREKREQERLEEEKNKRRAQIGSNTARPPPVKKQRDSFKMEAKHAEKEQPLEENEETLEQEKKVDDNELSSGHTSDHQERGYEEGISDSLHEDVVHSHNEADQEQVYIQKETRQEDANLNQNSETSEQQENAEQETITVQDEATRTKLLMDPEIPVDFSKKIEKKPKKMKEPKDTASKETQKASDIFNEWYLKPAYEVIARLERVALDIYPKYQQCKENTLCFSAVSMIFFLVTLIKFTQWFNYLFRRRKPSGNNQEYIYKELPAFDLKDVAENLKLIREKISGLEEAMGKNEFKKEHNSFEKNDLSDEKSKEFTGKLELALQTQEKKMQDLQETINRNNDLNKKFQKSLLESQKEIVNDMSLLKQLVRKPNTDKSYPYKSEVNLKGTEDKGASEKGFPIMKPAKQNPTAKSHLKENNNNHEPLENFKPEEETKFNQKAPLPLIEEPKFNAKERDHKEVVNSTSEHKDTFKEHKEQKEPPKEKKEPPKEQKETTTKDHKETIREHKETTKEPISIHKEPIPHPKEQQLQKDQITQPQPQEKENNVIKEREVISKDKEQFNEEASPEKEKPTFLPNLQPTGAGFPQPRPFNPGPRGVPPSFAAKKQPIRGPNPFAQQAAPKNDGRKDEPVVQNNNNNEIGGV